MKGCLQQQFSVPGQVRMGNCVSTNDAWIAKETFHPSEDLKETDNLKLLKINKDDKLKMLDDQVCVGKV